jgi:ABC-type nitrate/sulfonate/bicarbonate transport system substrate-binding protein
MLSLGVVVCSSRDADADDDGFIHFTTEPTALSLPFWYAELKGIFGKHGIKYADADVNTAFVGLQQIGAGLNDVSAQSDPPTVTNIAAGIDAIIPAVMAKGHKSMSLVAKKSINNITELKGKKVAWMGGTGGELGLMKYAEAQNLSLSDFQHVDLPPAEAVPTLVLGNVDAIWYWEPWPRKALAIKPDDVHVVATSAPEFYEPNMILTVRRTFAAEKPLTLKKFLSAMIEAVDALSADRATAIEILAKRLRTSKGDAELALNDYVERIYLSGSFVKEVTFIAEVMRHQGKMKSSPDWKKVIDPTYLRAVAPERVEDFPY